MKTPKFWTSKNAIALLLYPIGAVYGFATNFRTKINKGKAVNIPVICIGNLTAGGTGKTPVSISLAKLLKQKKYNPFFVSRGYGGSLKGVIVDNKKHQADEVGDEPLLLSQEAFVSINSDRYLAATKAIENGADIIIMDDGFQNPSLKKDLSFIVIDGVIGFGNGFCVPAGPLRESVSSGLKRADAIIIIGEDKHNIAKQTTLPIFNGKIEAIKPKTNNKNIIAFAGIGRPEKFYTSLRELNLNLLETMDFPDHHKYTKEELETLVENAKNKKADIFTTTKDMVKIPTDLQHHFQTLEIEIKWQDETKLIDFILKKVK